MRCKFVAVLIAMEIGSLTIDPPVFMAPMAGITDSPYRRVLRQSGCPAVVTEMISAEGLIRSAGNTLRLLDYHAQEHPIIAQLFGSQIQSMARSAKMCQERGFDAIDINMGCPVKKVVRHGAGAALMKTPEKAAQLVKAVKDACDLPVTVKLRSGWSLDEINVIEVAQRVSLAGADAVCVHPRTRSQFFSGKADWSWIAKAVTAVDIPVIGNGDIFSARDATRMLEQTKCHGLMLARAALGNPYMPAVIAKSATDPSPQMIFKAFCTHLELMIAWLGSEQLAVLRMRKHLVWYAKGLRGVADLRRKLHEIKTAEQMRAAYLQLLETYNRSIDTARSDRQVR